MTVTNVAFIGVGAMGGPMAQRVHEAGFGLLICDLSEATLEPFARQGIQVTKHAADCVDCDVAILMVATFEQAHGVLFGPSGLLSASPERRPSIVIMMGTVSPKAVRDVARDLAPFGIGLVDAPVSGGIDNAIGIANIMISAEAYRIALDNGLDLDDFVPVIDAGSGRNFFTASTRDAPEAYAAWAPTLPAFRSCNPSCARTSISPGPSGSVPAICR